jgi:hypothetical protein
MPFQTAKYTSGAIRHLFHCQQHLIFDQHRHTLASCDRIIYLLSVGFTLTIALHLVFWFCFYEILSTVALLKYAHISLSGCKSISQSGRGEPTVVL